MQLRSLLAVAVGLVLGASSAQAGEVLNKIKADGKLVCIVNPNSPGFSVPDSKGVFQGFNVEFCRMAAAAIFGDTFELVGVGRRAELRALRARPAKRPAQNVER